MSLGIGRDEEQNSTSSGSLPSPTSESGEMPCVPSGHRETFTNQKNALIDDLIKCSQEGGLIGQLVQGLVAVSSLPATFRLSDALSFKPESAGEGTPPHVEALKAIISEKVISVANKADVLFDTSEAKRAHLERLERQFDDMLDGLIEDERTVCAARVEALCDRIDGVTQRLGEEFPGGFDGRVQGLRLMGMSLRAYRAFHLVKDTESSSAVEVISSSPSPPSTSVSVQEFFERLKSETVDILDSLSDHSLA